MSLPSTIHAPQRGLDDPLVAWAWQQETAGYSAKLILLLFAFRADDDHECAISMDEIARETHVSTSNVKHALNRLREAGLVTSRRPRLGPGSIAVYRLCVDTDARSIA